MTMDPVTMRLRHWALFAWALLLASALGAVTMAGLPAIQERVLQVYDRFAPVVTMDVAKIMWRDEDAALVKMAGDKHRACKYLYIRAYARERDGALRDNVHTWRDDQAEDGSTKPAEERIDIGIWRVDGIRGASAVVFFVSHDCGGRLVLTQMADIALTEAP